MIFLALSLDNCSALLDPHDPGSNSGESVEYGRIMAGNHQLGALCQALHTILSPEIGGGIKGLGDGHMLSMFS